ncbi:MAG: UDP-3-O-(3-hydroxymyristoyl)glucosamine N-acyltransferase [Candidatus Riflebacteria bacterium]|nr:UDP-3-O-(3-hydroxymyristoyl)glucosamine N-acyltransferase [Candidatus Riflebacteria bacterium]
MAPKANVNLQIPLGALAEIAEGELVGDSKTLISGVSELDKAKSGDITYAVNKQYVRGLKRCRASAVVVPMDVTKLDRPIIRSKNPYWSFARILEVFSPQAPRPDPAVHPQAWVSPKARLGTDVVIRPFAVVEDGAVIGDGTWIDSGVHVGSNTRIGAGCRVYPNVTIRERCHIGDGVIIQSGTVVGSDGYGFVRKNNQHYKIPQIGSVVIGDRVEIGANVTIDRATIGRTIIGTGSKIDNLVQIGHNVEIGENALLVAQVGISGSTKIGDQCRFAGQAATVGHLTVGARSTIAARGVVFKDLPADSFVSGFPAKPHREELRILALMRKLPDLNRRLAALERELQKLSRK